MFRQTGNDGNIDGNELVVGVEVRHTNWAPPRLTWANDGVRWIDNGQLKNSRLTKGLFLAGYRPDDW